MTWWEFAICFAAGGGLVFLGFIIGVWTTKD